VLARLLIYTLSFHLFQQCFPNFIHDIGTIDFSMLYAGVFPNTHVAFRVIIVDQDGLMFEVVRRRWHGVRSWFNLIRPLFSRPVSFSSGKFSTTAEGQRPTESQREQVSRPRLWV
jgi:hypothetical protein